jgi:uncharacterized protein (DUF1499 family)
MAEVEIEKENDEWLRSTSISRSLEFFKQMEIMADEESVIEVANKFFKFLKGE